MQNYLSSVLVLLAAAFFVQSCEYKNEEELFPKKITPADSCVTTNVSYAQIIQPIFTESCAYAGCHTGSSVQFSSGIDLSSYQKTEETTPSQLLLDVIKHVPGNSRMPQGAEKLEPCKIAQIEAWINEGRQNN